MDHAGIIQRLEALESANQQMLRLGLVTEVLEAEGKVRVKIMDPQCMETFKLPVLCHKTQYDKAYWLPDPNEQVLCIFLDLHGGRQMGFVLGAIYSEVDRVPVADKDKAHIKFADGSVLEYDRAGHSLRIESVGSIEIQAKNQLTFRSPSIDFFPEATVGEPIPLRFLKDATLIGDC